jgi:diaminohydroxyphosphoribosylaminopyrimidine deaminase/5-amino-6-(5-phosphoribosylamino)uracil reductase
VLADDPSLTARDADGELLEAQPVPVVFGRREVPAGAALARHPHDLLQFTGDDLGSDLVELQRRGIRSLFVEGGPRLASAFLAAGLADEVLVYLAPAVIGGPRTAVADVGVTTIADALRFDFADLVRLGDDLLVVARPRPVAHPDPITREKA